MTVSRSMLDIPRVSCVVDWDLRVESSQRSVWGNVDDIAQDEAIVRTLFWE